jgi:hypothetical protein
MLSLLAQAVRKSSAMRLSRLSSINHFTVGCSHLTRRDRIGNCCKAIAVMMRSLNVRFASCKLWKFSLENSAFVMMLRMTS